MFMAKKLFIAWILIITVFMLSSVSICADDEVFVDVPVEMRGDFFIKNVIINGERIENYNLQYSLLTCDDVMYIPLTPEMCEIYGVRPEMDWENGTLELYKVDAARKNISENWFKNDAQILSLAVISDAKVFAYNYDKYDLIYGGIDESTASRFIAEEVDMKGLTLLAANNTVYVPLRAIADSEAFNWDIYYNNYYGLCLSTDSSIPAQNYFDEKEALENQGLVNYIMNINSGIIPSYGQQLVFLFKRAGEVYNVDPKLIIAMAHKESRFNNSSISRKGAAGIMQIMPATGARYGYTVEQLLEPKISIDFGTMYMSDRLAIYDGDWILALSAYNQGITSVNRGSFSKTFANSVISTYEGINNFLVSNGYVI
jgi:hypothetical protein